MVGQKEGGGAAAKTEEVGFWLRLELEHFLPLSVTTSLENLQNKHQTKLVWFAFLVMLFFLYISRASNFRQKNTLGKKTFVFLTLRIFFLISTSYFMLKHHSNREHYYVSSHPIQIVFLLLLNNLSSV